MKKIKEIPFFLKPEEDWNETDYEAANAAQEAYLQKMCGHNDSTTVDRLPGLVTIITHDKSSNPKCNKTQQKILKKAGFDRKTIHEILSAA